MNKNVSIKEINSLRKKDLVLKMLEVCEKSYCDNCSPRCPNYTPKKISHYCSICGEGIFEGDEYIENDDGEYVHYDCIQGARWLLEWLGYKVKNMEDIE